MHSGFFKTKEYLFGSKHSLYLRTLFVLQEIYFVTSKSENCTKKWTPYKISFYFLLFPKIKNDPE